MSDGKVGLPFTRIAERLRTADLPPREEVDAVVAIARGGTVPGALVAYELGRPLRLLQMNYRDDDNTPRHEAPTPLADVPSVTGQRILLVDDVSVSGATLSRARELLDAAHVTTLAFKGRPGAADVVLFPDVPGCVHWPWFEDVTPAPAPHASPRAIIVAGVSGSGKSTVGRMLADRLAWRYVEADDYHPPENVAKMRRGEPLSDADRAPWLAALKAELDASLARGEGVILTSSALKAQYRKILTGDREDVQIVLLHGPARLLADRLNARTGHFFDPHLLQSQLDTLELPAPGERMLVLDIEPEPDRIVDRITRELALTPTTPPTP